MLLLGAANPAFAKAQRPRHAVVMLIDDLGYGDTGHRGAEYPTTAIDQLATGGIILNQSYVLQLCVLVWKGFEEGCWRSRCGVGSVLVHSYAFL